MYLRKQFVKLKIFFLFLFLGTYNSLIFVKIRSTILRSSQICWMSSVERMAINSILNSIRKSSFNFHQICLFIFKTEIGRRKIIAGNSKTQTNIKTKFSVLFICAFCVGKKTVREKKSLKMLLKFVEFS